MSGDYVLLDTPAQWEACLRLRTVLDANDAVSLRLNLPQLTVLKASMPSAGALAVDELGRAYRSEPATGTIELARWIGGPASMGDPACVGAGTVQCARGIAIDGDGRMYVADQAAAQVHVIDTISNRTLRRVSVRTRHHRRRRPIDIAVSCSDVWVLLERPACLVRLRGRRGPLSAPALHPPRAREATEAGKGHGNRWRPERITASCGVVLVLWRRIQGATLCTEIADVDGRTVIASTVTATDLAFAHGGSVLVVAGVPDGVFRRFRADDGYRELDALDAPGYDGRGIAIGRNGEIVYGTALGLRTAIGPPASYETSGSLVSYRFDSGTYQNRWGRAFVDACIPPSTRVQLRFITTDDDADDDPLTPEPDPTATAKAEKNRPLPPRHLWEELRAHDRATAPLFRRGRSELVYQPSHSGVITYESVVDSGPGRYLWVVADLDGNQRLTPTISALRVETTGHRELQRLPAEWYRSAADADFLQRFLTPLVGEFDELRALADLRHALLNPFVAPADALGWVAGFVGLVLDERWPESARRTAIAEASALFRRRGTLAVTERYLEIYLGYRSPIVEQWRLRGIGGGLLGALRSDVAAPIIGQGTRMGGEWRQQILGLDGIALGSVEGPDGFATNAHRFLVLVPAELTDQQRDVVRAILELDKPAHTFYTLCETGSGMRVGRRLHVGLNALVGPRQRRERFTIGVSPRLGDNTVVGTPTGDGARLGMTTTAGWLRVG